MTRRSPSLDDGVSDETLLAGLAVGDEQAGVTFVRRYERRVFGLALTMVGDAGIAEDVAQEALVRVWKHAAVFDPRRASVATWVLTITRNLAIDALRIRKSVPVDPDDARWLALVSTERDPCDSAVVTDSLSRAHAALGGLPSDQRRAVLLAAMYGRSASEIATSESIPLGTAKSRIRMGMAKLRDAAFAEAGP